MKFSMILPTRERVKLFSELCESIKNTTYNLSDIEMFAVYDFDDETIKSITPHPWLNLVGRERGKSISVDYQNWIYPRTSGKYIMVLNDDLEFKTRHWDVIAFDKLERFTKNNSIAYGWLSDSDRKFGGDPPYSCFPILSRAAIDLLGYVMNPFYGGWSADVYLYKVYNGVGRVLDLSEILVYHKTHWLGLRDRDETNYSMERMSANKENQLNPKNDVDKLMGFAPLLL